MQPGARARSTTAAGGILALPAVLALAAVCLTHAATSSFLWKATSKNGGSAYLVGSVHLLSQDYYPLNPALDAAFKDSTLLVEEVDMAEMLASSAQLDMLTRGMLPGTQTLDRVVSPDTIALVDKTIAGLGLPAGPLKRFKPWMLALTLLGLEWQKAGFDPDLGIDRHFYDQARSEGKPVQGLETLAYQLSRFDEMSAADQDRLLFESLKELGTEMASVRTLADAWKVGDAATVERIVLEDLKAEPLLYQRLLVERNRNWFPQIEALLARPGRAMIVVGAAHLVGPDGLLSMLRAAGYTVEQL